MPNIHRSVEKDELIVSLKNLIMTIEMVHEDVVKHYFDSDRLFNMINAANEQLQDYEFENDVAYANPDLFDFYTTD